MKWALLSDVHSNWMAWKACVAHARLQGVTHWAILGDLVGYGPHPSEVVEAAQDLQVTAGAVVLRGSGGHFCAGGDITEMAVRPVLRGRMRMELAVRIFRLLATGPKPFLCAVEGNAAGCGVSFAAASDYCVAASDGEMK